MALLKTKPYKYNLETTYWAVDELNLNYANKTSHCVLFGYLSENSKKVNNEQPTETISFDWSGNDFDFIKDGDNITKAYTKIKLSKLDEDGNETNFFVGAVDC